MTDAYGLDRSLRVFLTAANYGSFTAAADALGATQPAVSHAVRRLENELGQQLLLRQRTGVVPTAVGEQLLASIGTAYQQVNNAVAAARLDAADPTVSICVSTSLATWWLLPRLPEFKRAHPDIELRLVTTDTDDHVDLAALDLWIPLGTLERSDLTQVTMCDEILVPVAAPSVAAQFQGQPPSALLSAPLLHLEERYRPRFDWPAWFESQDCTPSAKLPGDRLTDYSLVIHAALAGQGVALGWLHLVADLLADERLAALGPATRTTEPFVVAYRTDRSLRPGAAAFRDWIVNEMTTGPQQR